MKDAHARLAEWFEDYWGEKLPSNSDTDLFRTFGIEGDDAFESMDDFGARFGIDGENYLWYFHHREKGTNFGALFFKPPYARVQRMPITPNILIEAIENQTVAAQISCPSCSDGALGHPSEPLVTRDPCRFAGVVALEGICPLEVDFGLELRRRTRTRKSG